MRAALNGAGSGLALLPAYVGPDHLEARLLEQRARESGLTVTRARVVAHIGSFSDGWLFRTRLAKLVGCSVRTVQRAISQAKQEGLIGVARAKPNEVPPGGDAKRPLSCGFSHRWVIGRGLAAAAAVAAIAAAKLEAIARRAAQQLRQQLPQAPKRQPSPPPRRWTAEEIDAALAKPPPE